MSLTFPPSGVLSVNSLGLTQFGSALTALPQFGPGAVTGSDLLGGPSSQSTLAPVNQLFTGGAGEPIPNDSTLSSGISTHADLRVRLRALSQQASQIYGEKTDDGSNILSILHDTDGVLFPYTPSVSIEQSVDYKSIDLTHANGDIYAYSRTPSVTINITGKFTVQNQREGKYLVAVIHFLRTVSKMNFGELAGDKAGLPPPILRFSGYGQYMWDDVRCVLKTHSYSLEDSVDYVNVTIGSTVTRVPSLLTISVSLGVQQTPSKMRKEFNLEEFRTGKLMRSGGWI